MHLSRWTYLDMVFTGIILISTGFALTKGLAREVISLIALFGGFFLAVLYYPIPAKIFADFSRSDTLPDLLGFVIIFLGCILVGALVSFLLNRLLKAVSLKWFDRFLGGIFGFLRGWAICSILVVGIVAFPVHENIVARSFLAPYLLAGARAATLLVPQELKGKFNRQYRKVLEIWNQNRGAR